MPLQTQTTVADILEMAFAKVPDVSPENIATQSEELKLLVNRSLDGLFAFAARINPHFFGTSEVVVSEDDGWLRPQDAESVFRIEVDGVEVAVVPFEQREVEAGDPSVYAMGQYYRPTGMPLGPDEADDLEIFFSRRPIVPDPQTLDSLLDVAWPEAFNELLALEVAIYLAQKEGINDRAESLRVERTGWAGRFVAFLQHETTNVKRGWATTSTQISEAITMLAGGGA